MAQGPDSENGVQVFHLTSPLSLSGLQGADFTRILLPVRLSNKLSEWM
jgi:hypothetical protein